jgi:hypothetical protein
MIIFLYFCQDAINEEHFELMITYLKHRDVERNSLAESGMRVLRCLEVEHDGLRTPKGRENGLKIYQAPGCWATPHSAGSLASTAPPIRRRSPLPPCRGYTLPQRS